MGIKNKNASKIISSELNIFEAFLFIRDHGGNTFVQSFKINYIFDNCKYTNKINT